MTTNPNLLSEKRNSANRAFRKGRQYSSTKFSKLVLLLQACSLLTLPVIGLSPAIAADFYVSGGGGGGGGAVSPTGSSFTNNANSGGTGGTGGTHAGSGGNGGDYPLSGGGASGGAGGGSAYVGDGTGGTGVDGNSGDVAPSGGTGNGAQGGNHTAGKGSAGSNGGLSGNKLYGGEGGAGGTALHEEKDFVHNGNVVIAGGSGGSGANSYGNTGRYATEKLTFAGNGGEGGSAALDGNNLTVTGNLDMTGGTGGTGGVSSGGLAGSGGNGGNTSLQSENVLVNGNSYLTGGDAGSGGAAHLNYATGGSGGDGGNVTIETSVMKATGSLNIQGGDGKSGGNGTGTYTNQPVVMNFSGRGGDGGNGGNVTLRATKTIATDTLEVTSGSGLRGGNSTYGEKLDADSGKGGQGGNGGSVEIKTPDLTITSDASLKTAGGGDGGNSRSNYGGNGGESGSISLDSTNFIVGGNLELLTGTAGDGMFAWSDGIGGDGGNSGNIDINSQNIVVTGDVDAQAGNAGKGGNGNQESNNPVGKGGQGGTGGNGGDIRITAENITSADTITLSAGNGGGGGNGDNYSGTNVGPDGAGGTGGNGGNIFVDVTGTLQAKTLELKSGLDGADSTAYLNPGQGGQAGIANLNVATLITEKATFTQQDGDLTATIEALDLSSNDTELVLNNTRAWDGSRGVLLGDLIFGEGKNLTINGNGFAFNGNLTVLGLNASYVGPSLDMQARDLTFHLPSHVTHGDIMLTSENPIDIHDAQVYLRGGTLQNLIDGFNEIILIDNTDGIIQNNRQIHYMPTRGATFYDLLVHSDTGQLVIHTTPYEEEERPKSRSGGKAYSNGELAALIALQRSSDLVARFTMTPETGCTDDSDTCQNIFLTSYGSDVRVKTGSHVDVRGFSFMGGVTARAPTSHGSLLGVGFVEGGWGNYSSHNNFSFATINGSGDTHYYGLGGILRHDFANRFYVEGSIRGGRIKSDYNTRDMGDGAEFDTSVWYIGSHAGLGYKWQFNALPSSDLDTYARLMWTRHNGKDVTTKAGESLHFSNAQSLVSRLGTRWNQHLSDQSKLYAGIAWDYEHKGTLNANLDGSRVDRPDMGGSTGLVEIGGTWNTQSGWTFDINARGMFGRQDGIGGMVHANYRF